MDRNIPDQRGQRRSRYVFRDDYTHNEEFSGNELVEALSNARGAGLIAHLLAHAHSAAGRAPDYQPPRRRHISLRSVEPVDLTGLYTVQHYPLSYAERLPELFRTSCRPSEEPVTPANPTRVTDSNTSLTTVSQQTQGPVTASQFEDQLKTWAAGVPADTPSARPINKSTTHDANLADLVSTPAPATTIDLTPNNSVKKRTPKKRIKREHCVKPANNIYNADHKKIPKEIKDLVAAIQVIKRNKDGMPVRTYLRGNEEFKAHFEQGCMRLKRSSPLMEWYGDTRLFEQEFWEYLVAETPKQRSQRAKSLGGVEDVD